MLNGRFDIIITVVVRQSAEKNQTGNRKIPVLTE